MPLRKTSKRKTAPRRRRAPMRRRVYRRRMNVPDMAKCTVTRTVANGATNQMFSYDNFQLADFPRAVQVAQAYQRFRIASIRVTWKPAYDTYQEGGVFQKPNLYYMVDRSGAIPDGVTLEALKQAGARPKRFDEKPISVQFKPGVLGGELNLAGAQSAAGYKVSPLLSTNANATLANPWAPSTVAHQGIKWYMEQPGGNTTVYVEVEINFEFYKPIWVALGQEPAQSLQYAVLDASPDGVEGGTDGVTIPLVNV